MLSVADKGGKHWRGRENPISTLGLTKHYSILKNMFLSKKSFFLHSLTTEEESEEENKIHFSKRKKEEQETPDKTKLQLHALDSGLNLFKMINIMNSYFNSLHNY